MSAVYIHIPYCVRKCLYCDFCSVPKDDSAGEDASAVAREIELRTKKLKAKERCQTVFFGGGTPSILPAEDLITMLDAVRAAFEMDDDAEISLECNPATANLAELIRLKEAGFNRISIGLQSADDGLLKTVGRAHSCADFLKCFMDAREAGFENINTDLMYGLPGQTLSQWRDTVTNIVSMRPDHISCYALKLEENTPLWGYKDKLSFPDDDKQADMYLAACEILGEYGYRHYEISNFAKKGKESRHNLKYWNGAEYLGFGPSAASDFAGKRFTIKRDLHGYIDGIAKKEAVLSECESIPLRERAGEYIMLRLRTLDGINAEEYERNYLMPFGQIEQLMQRFADNGFAEKENERWRLTEKGWLVSNRIIVAINELQERSTPLAKKR